MKQLWTVLRHFLAVALLLGLLAIAIGLSQGAEAHFDTDETAFRAADEGPHVFERDGAWIAQVIRGSRDEGFRVEETRHALDRPFALEVRFPLDGSRFRVQADPRFETPPARHETRAPILALSDIEGSYLALRNFLQRAGVVDAELRWRFGAGHLVLLGDFVDRGPSVTQVLWLIHKLEDEAAEAGGRVHFILGNHEIKNLQGDLQAMHKKYLAVSAILGRQRTGLLGEDAFLGRWLASKNTVERINGTLFVHGGLHPALAGQGGSLEDINDAVRANYRRTWYPGMASGALDLLLNPKTGPAWYRGYFEDEPAAAPMQDLLRRHGATAVVVGHTLQRQVNSRLEGRVYAIDVRHPLDHRKSLPWRRSEGLWIEQGAYWRVLEDGSRELL